MHKILSMLKMKIISKSLLQFFLRFILELELIFLNSKNKLHKGLI